MSDELLSAALACIEAGISIIPIDHTTKRPAMHLLPKGEDGRPTWKPYQSKIADEATVRRWFEAGIRSFAVVCGQVSGGLLVLDFDAPGFCERWAEVAGSLANGLPVQQTGGGGNQVLLRCPNPGGNDKLAWTPDEQEATGRTIAIETRGEGGYAVVAPSIHPSGNRYRWLTGDATNVLTVEQDHADRLMAAARALDKAPLTRQEQERAEAQAGEAYRKRHAQSNGQASVIDAFNQAHSIDALLERSGYTKGTHGRYIRPGGKSESVSVKDGRSCHWSSDDPLNDGRGNGGCGWHDAFDLYTHYEHGGEVSKAVAAAAGLMGMKPARDAQTNRKSGPADTPPSIEPYKPFPVDALPGAVAAFVGEGAKALGCDAAYIAMPLLAALASAVGNSRRIRLKASWSEPPVLWVVVVGDSGTLKSPAFDLALHAIRLRQKRAMQEYKRSKAEYRDAKEQHDEAVKAWRKAKSTDRGERPEEPEVPVCERLWCSDTTVEALADRLSNAPRGLLVARDELAGWLASFNQYKAGQGGDVAHWLEMHRAGNLLVDRKTGDKTTIYVPHAAVCIAGGIQPETLRRCLTSEFYDNGLAARLLLASPPRRVKQWTEADIDSNTLDVMSKLFTELLSFQPSTDVDGEPEPAAIELTDAAKAIWVAFYNQHAQEQAELGGELSAAWSKLEGYAARLAMVSHCVRQAAGEAVNAWRCDEVSMASGVALAAWFGHEAKRVYGLLCEGPEDRDCRRLVELLQAKGGKATVRELSRSSRLHASAGDWEQALEKLAEAGRGRWQNPKPGPIGGHPVRVFHLLNQPGAEEGFNTLTVDGTPDNDSGSGGSDNCQHVNGGSNPDSVGVI